MNSNLLITKFTDKDIRSWTLTSRIGEILELATQLFGQINSDYFFLGIEFEENSPRIQYQSQKYILIHLTPSTLDDEYLAYYQLSHEVYHLLSPTGKYDANNLEEGLATYFSKLYLNTFTQNVFDWEKATQADPKYYSAYMLVVQLLQIDPGIIKAIREKYPTIKTSHLSFSEFEAIMGDKIPGDLINKLLEPFPAN